jgi:hypothetical protein
VIIVQIFFMAVATNPRKTKIVKESAAAAAKMCPFATHGLSSMTFGEEACRLKIILQSPLLTCGGSRVRGGTHLAVTDPQFSTPVYQKRSLAIRLY